MKTGHRKRRDLWKELEETYLQQWRNYGSWRRKNPACTSYNFSCVSVHECSARNSSLFLALFQYIFGTIERKHYALEIGSGAHCLFVFVMNITCFFILRSVYFIQKFWTLEHFCQHLSRCTHVEKNATWYDDFVGTGLRQYIIQNINWVVWLILCQISRTNSHFLIITTYFQDKNTTVEINCIEFRLFVLD